MNINEIAEKSWGESVRIDQMFSLAMFADQLPETIIEELRYDGGFEIEDLLGTCPEGYTTDEYAADEDTPYIYDIESNEFSEIILEDILNKQRYGFFAKVSTPVRSENGSYSWGHYTSKWIYAETVEELFEKALDLFSRVST